MKTVSDYEDAIQEVTPISAVFKEYRAYYRRRKKELDEALKTLPPKGSVRRLGVTILEKQSLWN